MVILQTTFTFEDVEITPCFVLKTNIQISVRCIQRCEDLLNYVKIMSELASNVYTCVYRYYYIESMLKYFDNAAPNQGRLLQELPPGCSGTLPEKPLWHYAAAIFGVDGMKRF